ncbi:MAG: transcriptional repressor [Deltaproteobacteria bacterium]|nr:transcriptional repressor [Deltaproteobacteria bacterium]
MQRRPQTRNTHQLQAVYQAVCQSSSHPSADEVYWHVRRNLPRISLGTVYHNLQRLVAQGKISVVLLGERTARYDPTTTAHAHFVCQQCGQVEDVFLSHTLLGIDLNVLARQGYRITAHNLLISGLCPTCGGRRSARLQ